MSVRSKLPDVGTTVFTLMSRRAAETGAINLGQGHNQYAPMAGLAALREQIARKLQRCYAVAVDPESEITVTVGATEALYSSIQALVGTGDEVIIFDPAYDSYDPAVRLAGALIAEAGVATIPLSVFYREPPPLRLLRLCFDKREQTLIEGARRPAPGACAPGPNVEAVRRA